MTLRFRDVATVSLYVGQEKAAFQVHMNLLCTISTFFKAAFSSEFSEAAERSMHLEEDDVNIFERFVAWLYTKRYDLSCMGKDQRYMELAKLYVLADKYDVSRLKNGIIDQLFELHEASCRPPSHHVVTYVYNNSTMKSSFRKLLVGWAAWHIDFGWFSKESTPECLLEVPEYAADLAIALGKRLHRPALQSPFTKGRSFYYEDVKNRV